MKITKLYKSRFIRVRNGKCGSVVNDEGLRSHKAIAFINSKGNICLETSTYSEPCMFPQRKTAILSVNVESSIEMDPDVCLTSNMGETLWKK